MEENIEFIKNDDYPYQFNALSCEACGGHCCTGESGYIWVKYNEIEAIANF